MYVIQGVVLWRVYYTGCNNISWLQLQYTWAVHFIRWSQCLSVVLYRV